MEFDHIGYALVELKSKKIVNQWYTTDPGVTFALTRPNKRTGKTDYIHAAPGWTGSLNSNNKPTHTIVPLMKDPEIPERDDVSDIQVEQKFDGTQVVETRSVYNLTKDEVLLKLKDRMMAVLCEQIPSEFDRLFIHEVDSQENVFWGKLKKHGWDIWNSYEDGKEIDLKTGAIEGKGSWPKFP